MPTWRVPCFFHSQQRENVEKNCKKKKANFFGAVKAKPGMLNKRLPEVPAAGASLPQQFQFFQVLNQMGQPKGRVPVPATGHSTTPVTWCNLS